MNTPKQKRRERIAKRLEWAGKKLNVDTAHSVRQVRRSNRVVEERKRRQRGTA